MRIYRKAKKYEEVAEVFYVAKYEEKMIIDISFIRGENKAKQTLKFSDVDQMNIIFDRLISDELVDITEYC